MLAKILGAFLLVIGVVLGVKLLFKTIGFLFSLVLMLAGAAVVVLLVYAGWRLLDR
jgi:hypothetical protein